MHRILIVEDNEMNRDMLSRRLERRGFEVTTAVDGRDGIAQAISGIPDLILMDMNLPEIDGWEATRILKSDSRTTHIPVIALTAHAMVGDRERAIMAGFHNYLTKPLTPATFMKDLLVLLTDIPAFAHELTM